MKRIILVVIMLALFTPASVIAQNLKVFMRNGKYGYRDSAGKEIVAPKYDKTYTFSEGLATVVLNGKKGKINTAGREVIPPKYDEIYAFSERLATVVLNGKYGVIDVAGREIVIPKYDRIYAFSGGHAQVVLNGKRGIINTVGREITPPKYDKIETFQRVGFTIVVLHGKHGYIDSSGKEVIPPDKYDDISGFSKDGLAYVWLNGKIGKIDRTGKEVVPPKYDGIYAFSDDGLAMVRLGEKYGYVDKTGHEVTTLKYDYAYPFSKGLATVVVNGKFGVINKTGKQTLPIIFASKDDAEKYGKNFHPAEEYISDNVKRDLERWSMKDEFESTAEYQARVNSVTYEQKIKDLFDKYTREYATTPYFTHEVSAAENMGYDADRQTVLVSFPMLGDIIVKLPGAADGRSLRDNWARVVFSAPEFLPVKNDDGTERLVLSRLTMTNPAHDNASYTWSINDNHSYGQTVVQSYEFVSIADALGGGVRPPTGGGHILAEQTVVLDLGPSDVDIDIPKTGLVNDKTFVVIFANENYQFEALVPHAINDGRVFRQYCIHTLGIPEANIRYVQDATKGVMITHLDWMERALAAHKGEAKAIVYYSGHGINNGLDGSAYLLPTDGSGSLADTGYNVNEMFNRLGAQPARSITYFMDACYSGAMRDGKMMASARGVAITVRNGEPKGNSVLFAACQDDQMAYAYDEKQHGMFTYFLLKSLKDSKGNISYEQLSIEIADGVAKASLVNRQSQTPLVEGSSTTGLGWKSWTFEN